MSAVVSVVAIVAAASVAGPLPDVELRIGDALQAEQRATETRTFHVDLNAGESYLVEAGQHELDLVIELTEPGGTRRTFDSPLLRYAPERILLQVETTGLHELAIRSRQSRGGTVQYTLRVIRWPPSAAAARLREDTLLAETRGAETNAEGGSSNWPRAVDAYRTAAAGWAALHEAESEARARLAAAWLLYLHLSAWEEAMAEAEAAARLYEGLGDRSGLASALHVHGAILIEVASEAGSAEGDSGPSPAAEALFERSLLLLEEARAIRQALGNDYEHGRVVNDLGLAHYNRGNWAEARAYFARAARQLGMLQEWAQELVATRNVATVDYAQGNLVQALAGYERVLELMADDVTRADHRGNLLNNMGAAHRALGQVDRALSAFSRALAEHEAFGSMSGRARSLSGLGVTYFSAGELELAREYLERALPLRREARDGPGQVSTLLYLGDIYRQQGEVERAVDTHREAAALAVTGAQRARAGVELGRDLVAAGRKDEALQVLAGARDAAEQAGTPVVAADALLERGRLEAAAGRPHDGVEALTQALELYAGLGWATGEASALFELARAWRASGDLVRAYDFAAASVQRTEALRSLIASPELRASYLAAQREHFAQYVDIAMELAQRAEEDEQRIWIERALAMTERGRTRAMLDLLQESAEGSIRAADPLLARRRIELYQALAGLRFRQERLMSRQRSARELEEIRDELARVETELQVLESELRIRDPRHAAIAAPEVLDAAAIQGALEADTMLLQYQLGRDRSWLFAVSADSISAHPLPPAAEIEALVQRAYVAQRRVDPDPGVVQRRDEVLRQLGRWLVEPARPVKPRLVVAADGALHYLPFAALLVERDSWFEPLIAGHEVASVPSISVVVTQRALRAARQPQRRTVAIFADPVYQGDDPRLGNEPAPAVAGVAGVHAAAWSADTLRRLPATGEEARAIAELVPAEQRWLASGFDASRDAVLGAELGEFRIIHFATHALLDDRYPALSALALSSLGPDRAPRDALLRLHDVYNLELGAELVTLSACETALGRELRGEGLVGLARGFLHAGSSVVVASLWQVPDRATTEFMRHFYRAQLADNLAPAAALRQAQQAVAAERAWRDPYFWAAFVAYGDWRSEARDGRATTTRTEGIR